MRRDPLRELLERPLGCAHPMVRRRQVLKLALTTFLAGALVGMGIAWLSFLAAVGLQW